MNPTRRTCLKLLEGIECTGAKQQHQVPKSITCQDGGSAQERAVLGLSAQAVIGLPDRFQGWAEISRLWPWMIFIDIIAPLPRHPGKDHDFSLGSTATSPSMSQIGELHKDLLPI